MKSIFRNYSFLCGKFLWFSILMTTNIMFLVDVLLSIFIFDDFNFNQILLNNLIIGPVLGYVLYKVLNTLPPKENNK